jgi:hypothetical protein
MSSTRIRRVPMARTLAIACAGLALATGAAQAEAPVAGAGDIRLCGAGSKSSYVQDLALYQTADGIRLLKIPAAELADELAGVKSADSACAKATAAGLAVVFPGMPAIPTVSGVTLVRSAGTPRNFDLLDPVVCDSFGAGSTSLVFGANNSTSTVAGWEAISYDLATRTIRLSAAQGAHGPLAQCYVFPYETTVESPPAGGPRPNVNVFSASFENRGDLLVEILATGTDTLIGEISVYPDVEFDYDVEVTNFGEVPLEGITIREFLPALPRTLGSSQVVAPVQAGAWTCEGPRCPAASGTGLLSLAGMTLAQGEKVTFTLTRKVATGGDTGVLNVAAIAAFVDSQHPTGGAEQNPEDNAVPLVLSVQANQPPVFNCTPTSVLMSEDGTPVDVSCVLSDAEDDPIAPMTIANAGDAAVTALLESAPLAVASAGANTYDFTVQPRPNANGSVTLQLQTSDEVTGTSQYNLTVNVSAVDDAPTFNVAMSTLNVYADGVDHDAHYSAPISCAAAISGFNCEASRLQFFTDLSGGPSDESAQTLTPVLTAFGTVDANHCGVSIPGDGVGHFFSKLPEMLQDVDGTYAIRFSYKTTATGSVFCDFRFRDSGGIESAPVRVTFSMQPPPAP